MKLNENFISYNVDGENILVCLDSKRFAGVIKLNGTALVIVEKLKNEISREKLVEELLERYIGVTAEKLAADADRVIAQLSSVGAIDQ